MPFSVQNYKKVFIFQYFFLSLCPEKRKKMIKVSKKQYLQGFGFVVIVLALVRCAIFPDLRNPNNPTVEAVGDSITSDTLTTDTIKAEAETKAVADAPANTPADTLKHVVAYDPDFVPHRIWSVPDYSVAFPDSQDVQFAAAQRYGVKPVRDRKDAERRKQELVYAGASPYFHVDNLRQSIPYLVPRASRLLDDIGRQFFDSLYVKGVPLHKMIVTSVLRTQDDVARLRRRNGNATENSCHMYGTTFDICYNRYKTVEDPDGPSRREVRNDTLKWILSEVLRDVRESGRAYIKYERKQGCFHITVR